MAYILISIRLFIAYLTSRQIATLNLYFTSDKVISNKNADYQHTADLAIVLTNKHVKLNGAELSLLDGGTNIFTKSSLGATGLGCVASRQLA